jgi:hypothetical protein
MLDPISAILAALAAGAAAAAKETGGSVMKDAYEGLKGLIKRKLAGKALASAALETHATEPAPSEVVLRPAMKDVAADRDDEILAAAKSLLALADRDGSVARRYSLSVHGNVEGLVQGDGATVTMNFGTRTPSKD